MAEERTIEGIAVTTGVVVAPLFVLPESSQAHRVSGNSDEERVALDGAIAASQAALETLAGQVSEEAADILAFQLALLEDEDLLNPIHDAIAAGRAADLAWRDGLDREIAEYSADDGDEAGDAVFSARAADLADLRDRVWAQLHSSDDTALSPPRPSIVFARDLPPSRFLEMDPETVAGIAMGDGSPTSHVCLLARAKGLPVVVGLGVSLDDQMNNVRNDHVAILDGEAGRLILNPSPSTRDAMAQRRTALAQAAEGLAAQAARPAAMADGTPVSVLINVDHPSVLDGIPASHCNGVGLTRTELLFQDGPPDEESQYASYRHLIHWADGRPVTIRTLDAGGDKPLPGLTSDHESNPFLGVRGIRLSLRSMAVFKVQLRALLRAAAHGPLKVMLPMITLPEEVSQTRALMADLGRDLTAAGIAWAQPALGIMVEVPVTAITAEAYDADFYSIGTNDLIQYGTAAARDNPAVAGLARADHPGILQMIRAVVESGRRRSVEVSVCGDMASNPGQLALLLEAGIRQLSVAPAQVGAVKAAIATCNADKAGR